MKTKIFITLAAIIVLLFLGFAWCRWISPTHIAFLQYQVITLEHIHKANENPFVKLREIGTEELSELNRYDMVFINGMGLRITEEQREQIRQAVAKGVPILSVNVTNPDNRIVSVSEEQADTLRHYLDNEGRGNYKNMLEYVRKYIDCKLVRIKEPEPPAPRTYGMLYHHDPARKDDDELEFDSVRDYEAFLKSNGLWKGNAPGIIVTGSMGDPSELVAALEETGKVVYPVRRLQAFITDGQADSIRPAAVVNLAHGRLGDGIVRYLSTENIPLFSPLNTNRLVEEWESDKMGMSGGFLSQSVVTPEIDGALRPFALFGQYKDSDGFRHAYAIPERLETFVSTLNNYLVLKEKANAEKKVAIFYFKGPGQNAMTAGGMEVGSSLYNLLKKMKEAGYRVELPASPAELSRLIQEQGPVFGGYAEGAIADFIREGYPERIAKEDYERWVGKSLRPGMYAEMVRLNGEFPGPYMNMADGALGIARIELGNVVLVPQVAAGAGDNPFKVVHGTDAAPPHPYIATYLWAKHAFQADALVHFGTHGSLEFTPRKQVALCSDDWPDRLVGDLPHFYVYTIGNVGEGVIAKRRSYAGLQSYLTPPFLESNVRGIYRSLSEKIKTYDHLVEENASEAALDKASLAVKTVAVELGIHRDLELDSIPGRPYTEAEVLKVGNFAEELATEKITGQHYVMGVPYEEARIRSSVFAMSVEPVAYGLFALDRLRGKAGEHTLKHKAVFTRDYLEPAQAVVRQLLDHPHVVTDTYVCRIAGVSGEELEKARRIEGQRNSPKNMMAMMMGRAPVKAEAKGNGKPGKPSMAEEKDTTGGKPGKEEYSKTEVDFALALLDVERTLKNVGSYESALRNSPGIELNSLLNALGGGYTNPSPGGDPIANPNTLPTGRNLFSINAEATPSESAWEKGVRLADKTIEMYRMRHNDSIPRKVSYTLWSSEFIETEGATIAQILYMLGVEPIRDAFGRVSDLRLIPSKQLGRPRIDVVVQTSGQLRDLAASRLFLIGRAVEMAGRAKDEEYTNFVSEGIVETERVLTEKGFSPKDAREMSAFRVFGGVNGGYGTGIQGMVMRSDRWESEKEIADTYLNNMGAYYGSEKDWEMFRQFAFEAALTQTDVVVQPRQSNTWGALSLDHVYEFMGGLNLAVRNVTGRDPDAYLSDYRNRRNVRMQEVKEAVGVESRTTLFNPTYIREKMKGGAEDAFGFAELVQNTYGWNVMKPKIIDKELWDGIFDVYVRDKFQLGLEDYFARNNPAALEEITAVMLEAARKGLWNAGEEQVAELARLHTEFVEKYKPSCSGFVCDNAKLRSFIAEKGTPETAEKYLGSIARIREMQVEGGDKAVVMKKDAVKDNARQQKNRLDDFLVVLFVTFAVALLAAAVIQRRRSMRDE